MMPQSSGSILAKNGGNKLPPAGWSALANQHAVLPQKP